MKKLPFLPPPRLGLSAIVPLLTLFSPLAAVDADSKDTEKSSSDDDKDDEKEEETPCHTFSANANIVSDYRFRGISQTMRRPAFQCGFDYTHRSGLYLGTWGSNIDGTSNDYNDTSLEWDMYGGWKTEIFPCNPCIGLKANIGLIYYYYPGGRTFFPVSTSYNTLEYYVEISHKYFSIKFNQAATNFFGVNSNSPPFNWTTFQVQRPNGTSRGSFWVEGNIFYDITDKLNLTLNGGYLRFRHYDYLDYWEWKGTLTYAFDGFSAFVTYVGTDADHNYYDIFDRNFYPERRSLGAQGFVFGISKTI